METQEHFKNYIEALNNFKLKEKDLFNQYALMKSAEKLLKERIDEVSNIIKEEMEKNGQQKIKNDFGNFTMTKKDVYEFPNEINQIIENKQKIIDSIEEEIQKLKDEEIKKGTAKVIEIKTSLRFT